MNQKVSIITPVYNAQEYIANCIESVLGQTYQNWELILVDDCSMDDSVSILMEYKNIDPRIKLYVSEKNIGAGAARNLGIKSAKGRYLAFLDIDDFWHKDKLEKQLIYMRKKQVAAVYSQYYIYDQKVNKVTYRVVPPNKVNFNKMQKNDYIGFLTFMIDTEKVGKPLMPTIRKRQDWAYKLLILKEGEEAHCIQEPLAYYRVGNQSLSSNKFKLIKHNFGVFRKILGYSKLKAIFKMGLFLTFHLIFKITSRKKVV